MTKAIPVVKPVITGKGINLRSTPPRAKPRQVIIIPAKIVAIARPS